MRIPHLLLPLALAGCAEALYPPRPPALPGPPVAEPAPSRVVVHAAVSDVALQRALEKTLPPAGEGTFNAFGGARRYTWKRGPIEIAFEQGRLVLHATAMGSAQIIGPPLEVPLDLVVRAEPVVTQDYQARLQSLDVQVTSNDPRLRLAQGLVGALDTIRDQIAAKLKDFAYDLRPLVEDGYRRIAQPIDLPLGDAHGCAELRVAGVEAAPTVLAHGVEKDVAVVVAPSVTLPCAAPPTPPALPPLANVASLPTGPFTVTVPVAARYEELALAMKLAFTDGKLFFSKEFPELYMADPEVYSAADQLVLKLHIAGPIKKAGIHTTLDGDIYFVGHPVVVDNELRVPDLQPTIETGSFLLKLKAALDGDHIRDEARAALRLDLGARLQSVRDRLSTDLPLGEGACMRGVVHRIEVTGVYPHGSYLRLYTNVTAQAGVYMPCPPK